MNDTVEIGNATQDAEESLLGAILIQSAVDEGESIRKAAGMVQPLDFRGCVAYEKPERWTRRARLFYAMTKSELPPHQINVALTLEKLGILMRDDCFYLAVLIADCPCSIAYMDYARAVKEFSVKRQARDLAGKGDIKGLSKLTKQEYKPLGPVPL